MLELGDSIIGALTLPSELKVAVPPLEFLRHCNLKRTARSSPVCLAPAVLKTKLAGERSLPDPSVAPP